MPRCSTGIKRQATDLYPDLMKNLALGIFEMRLKTHAPGTLRVARKLKRLVDLRFAPAPAEHETPADLDQAATKGDGVKPPA